MGQTDNKYLWGQWNGKRCRREGLPVGPAGKWSGRPRSQKIQERDREARKEGAASTMASAEGCVVNQNRARQGVAQCSAGQGAGVA